MAAFFWLLTRAGWSPGEGTTLHHAYLAATTITFAGIAFEFVFAAAVIFCHRCSQCSARPRSAPCTSPRCSRCGSSSGEVMSCAAGWCDGAAGDLCGPLTSATAPLRVAA